MTREEVLALPKYTDVKVRRYGKTRWQRACTIDTARVVGDYVLLSYSYTFLDRGEYVLHSQSHTLIIGGKYSDEVTL